jgi:hypothetical protein
MAGLSHTTKVGIPTFRRNPGHVTTSCAPHFAVSGS